MSLFTHAWWLPSPHAQTVWGRVTRRRQLVPFEREVLTTPDGDELVIDHLGTPARDSSKHVLFLHGLEGSSYSVYIQGMLRHVAARGWSASVMNFRSCARDPRRILRAIPNKRARLYHSGETTDFDFLVKTMRARHPERELLAIGSSLGGNVLLKWLGENPGQQDIKRAVTLSVPYDLAAGSRHLDTVIGRAYTRGFLKALAAKAARQVRLYPEAAERIDLQKALRAKTFFDYDDAATAPLHGFADAEDYYERSSSIRYVANVTTPTLCISAEDDPFLPKGALKELISVASSSIDLIFTPTGGHIGFVTGAPWRCRYWAEEHAIEWLATP